MFTYIILPLYSLYFCTVGKDGQDPCKQASNKTLADGNYGFTAERVTRASDNGDSQRPIKTSTDAPLRESHPLGRRNASRGPAAGSVCKYLVMGSSHDARSGHAEYPHDLGFGVVQLSSYIIRRQIAPRAPNLGWGWKNLLTILPFFDGLPHGFDHCIVEVISTYNAVCKIRVLHQAEEFSVHRAESDCVEGNTDLAITQIRIFHARARYVYSERTSLIISWVHLLCFYGVYSDQPQLAFSIFNNLIDVRPAPFNRSVKYINVHLTKVTYFSGFVENLCGQNAGQTQSDYQNEVFHWLCLFCYQFNTLFICIVFRISVLEYSQCAVVPLDIAPQTSGQFHQFGFACGACLKKFTKNLLTRWQTFERAEHHNYENGFHTNKLPDVGSSFNPVYTGSSHRDLCGQLEFRSEPEIGALGSLSSRCFVGYSDHEVFLTTGANTSSETMFHCRS